MHLIETHLDHAARTLAALPCPFGPGFSATDAESFDKIELHGTDCRDPGPDFCEFRAFTRGKLVAQKRIMGF
jgi:hypothetical protein